MEASDTIAHERKESLKNWFKENIYLLGSLIFAFVLQLYFFSITKYQTLWWDEAEYMATAKHWVFDIPYYINAQRPPLFPFLISIFYRFGFGELAIKFFLETVPFVALIFVTYLLVLEMYNDKKTALITSFIMSVSWILLFYSVRFMTDTIGFLFGLLAFLCFWKGYVHQKGNIYIWLIGPFVSLSLMCRLTGVLFGICIILFLLVTERFTFLKNKHMWISFGISFLAIIPLLLWDYAQYGNPLAFRSGYGGITYDHLGWQLISLVFDYPGLVFFIFFLFGLITLSSMFLSFDQLVLGKDKKYYADFFNILNILLTLAFFIYFLREAENRWLMMMSISIFVISAKGISFFSEKVREHGGKVLGIGIILVILFAGAYYQVQYADGMITAKIDSYKPVKDAALWMKQNSNPSDLVISASYTQTTYYAEREVISFFSNDLGRAYKQDELEKVIRERKPKYYVISVFEPWVESWTSAYPQNNSQLFRPVQAWFEDPQKTKPVLVIYEINQTYLSSHPRL